MIALEDKVDRIEEAFEDFEYGYTEPASSESVQQLEDRMDRIEGKLDQLISAMGQSSAGNTSGGQQGSSQSSSSQSSSSQNSSSQSSSERGAASSNGSQTEQDVNITQAARRKAQELGVSLSEVEGTGADGKITVEDVRKKGES